jgi:hypothetical protein
MACCLVSILLWRYENLVSNPGGCLRFALCHHSIRLSTYPRLRSRLRMPSYTVHWSRLSDIARACSVRDGTRHFHCTRKCGAVGRVIATAVPWYWIVGTLQGQDCTIVAAAICTITSSGKIIHFAYKCCVCLFVRSQNQQLIFHYATLKVIGFITETECIYCAVRTGCLSTTQSVPCSKRSPSLL